ncbi:hypothetical protein AB1K70_00060 [Bremerella sp. JC770]|uniref:hypothetical protein n=1 Tax=Bremerella sp. JC770 TaxID=3232137 RepID=UPI00345AC282
MTPNSLAAFSRCILVASLGLLVLGCSFGPTKFTVSGAVTLDGVPIKDGRVIFSPVDGGHEVDSAKVVQGAYEVDCLPGEKTVRIAGFTAEKKVIPSSYVMEPVELRANITEDTQLDFDLTSKVKRRR